MNVLTESYKYKPHGKLLNALYSEQVNIFRCRLSLSFPVLQDSPRVPSLAVLPREDAAGREGSAGPGSEERQGPTRPEAPAGPRAGPARGLQHGPGSPRHPPSAAPEDTGAYVCVVSAVAVTEEISWRPRICLIRIG